MSKAIFFDLDGTLTDPKVGITTSIQFALKKLNVEAPAKDELTWCIGPPLLESLSVLVGEDRSLRALEFFRERFSVTGWQENALYPGIADVLDRLTSAGCRLYVATSKPKMFADKIVDHFRISHFFNAVYGSELDGTRSNKTDLLRFALADTRERKSATMIGDREHDIVGALANGMTAIGVTYGYGSQQKSNCFCRGHWTCRVRNLRDGARATGCRRYIGIHRNLRAKHFCGACMESKS